MANAVDRLLGDQLSSWGFSLGAMNGGVDKVIQLVVISPPAPSVEVACSAPYDQALLKDTRCQQRIPGTHSVLLPSWDGKLCGGPIATQRRRSPQIHAAPVGGCSGGACTTADCGWCVLVPAAVIARLASATARGAMADQEVRLLLDPDEPAAVNLR
jgi:hypothetical protein